MTLLKWTTVLAVFLCFLLLTTRRRKAGLVAEDEDPYVYVNLFIVSFVALLIVVEGFRYGYQDTLNYKGIYHDFPDGNLSLLLKSSKQPGYDLIQWLLRKISTHEQFIIIVCAIFFTIADVVFIKKYASNFVFSLYLFFLLSFTGSMNGLRQLLAATFLMLAFPLLQKRKFWSYVVYILLIILMSSIHRSILVLIPLMLIYSGERWNKWLVLFLAFCGFSMVIPGPINFLIGRYVADEYSHYLTSYNHGASILHVLVEAVPLVLGYYYHKTNKPNVGENRVVDVLINMQAIRFGFMMLATNMAQYARIGMYLKNCTALIVPFLITKVFDKQSAKIVHILAIILYFALFVAENSTVANGGGFEVFYLDFSIFES